MPKASQYRIWYASGQYMTVTACGKRHARKKAIETAPSCILRATKILKIVDASVDWLATAKELGFR